MSLKCFMHNVNKFSITKNVYILIVDKFIDVRFFKKISNVIWRFKGFILKPTYTNMLQLVKHSWNVVSTCFKTFLKHMVLVFMLIKWLSCYWTFIYYYCFWKKKCFIMHFFLVSTNLWRWIKLNFRKLQCVRH